MSYKFSFADNEVYSATDVNNITKRLVTSGVADSFSDGAAYNVSQFNELGKLLYTAGVVSENCNTLKVVKISDTEILINPGTAFFNDGAVIEIEAGGEVMPFVLGSKNYVYLRNMLLDENRCYPCVSVNEPTGDFVLLAEIDENGKITDRRTYAMGKVPGYQSVAGSVMRIQDYIEVTKESGISSYFSGSKTFHIGNNNFEYILTYVKRDNYTLPCLGIYEIANKSYLGFYCTQDEKYADGSHYYYKGGNPSEKYLHISLRGEARFTLDNGILNVMVGGYFDDSPSRIEIDLILF